MRYREPEHEQLIATFVAKIDDIIDGWSEERDQYRSLYEEMRAQRDYWRDQYELYVKAHPPRSG